jgi:hypothetical protein
MIEDMHVHIGQYENEYYGAEAVFEAIAACGKVSDVTCSSTSTCTDDIDFADVEDELLDAERYAPSELTVSRLLWFKPAYIKQGVNIDNATYHAGYAGIKLHPFADDWNFENDSSHRDILHRVFELAGTNYDYVMIHTGESGRDSPRRFRKFFAAYPHTPVFLAHGRPARDTIDMMRHFPQILCDTAFMDEERLRAICEAGFAQRIVTGSDFPITHYVSKHGPYGENLATLTEHYEEDAAQMSRYLEIIERWTT